MEVADIVIDGAATGINHVGVNGLTLTNVIVENAKSECISSVQPDTSALNVAENILSLNSCTFSTCGSSGLFA